MRKIRGRNFQETVSQASVSYSVLVASYDTPVHGGGIFLYLLTQGRIKELLLLWISYYNSILRLISESSLLLFRIQFAHKWRISYIPLSECPTECFVGVSPSRPGCYCQPWICVQYLRIFRDYVTIINFGGWYWLINGE